MRAKPAVLLVAIGCLLGISGMICRVPMLCESDSHITPTWADMHISDTDDELKSAKLFRDDVRSLKEKVSNLKKEFEIFEKEKREVSTTTDSVTTEEKIRRSTDIEIENTSTPATTYSVEMFKGTDLTTFREARQSTIVPETTPGSEFLLETTKEEIDCSGATTVQEDDITDTGYRQYGARLHYYQSNLTWSMGKAFCSSLSKRLCRSTELCVYENGGREFFYDVIPGDHWVPVLNDSNEWLQIGDSWRRTCLMYGPMYGPPPWGTTFVSQIHKGYVYCCPGQNDTEPATSMKYRYIGNLATYDSSLDHCKCQDLRLCSSAEVCPKDSPSFGRVSGDMWVAVNDKYNEWIQIGDAYGSEKCTVHEELTWGSGFGTRTDRSEVEYVGYVYCCG